MLYSPRRLAAHAGTILTTLVLAASGAAGAQAPTQPAPTSQPIVREGVTARLSDHVWAIPDNSVPQVPNVGIIVGSRATLVIDTGMGARNAQAILREVAKVSRNAETYLVTTHFHPEHDLGAHGFPASTKMIRSRDQQADIAEFGLQMSQTFSSRSPFVADLLRDAQYRSADIVFDQEHVLDLGGVRVRVIAMGPNHTRGDTAIYVEPDGVLFAGDIVMKGQPNLSSPYSRVGHWLTSLDKLQALSPKTIVPSHGPVGGPELIAGYRDYFTAIRDQTAAAKRAGADGDTALRQVTDALKTRFPNEQRLGTAIRSAYAEAG